MGIWRSIAGTISIRITGADIPGTIKQITEYGIQLSDVVYISELTVTAAVHRKDFARVRSLLASRGDSCEISSKWGVVWSILQIQKRPVLVLGLLILMILTLYIPSRVLFIQVKGNENVETEKIVQALHHEGLYFGCSREKIRSEALKNSLLEKLPELDWIGITSSGCVATVEVRENYSEHSEEDPVIVSSLVAVCDAVVESVTATNGTPLCKPGQAVRRGQVLISGYQDHGLLIKASRASGEIYARTYRQLQVMMPAVSDVREQCGRVSTKFSLQIGKKQINFSKDSGISPAGCVKMYEKRYLTLPGGFQLPVAWITEKVYHCQSQTVPEAADSLSRAEEFADRYIRDQMIAGEVISKEQTSQRKDDVFILSVAYACREQIGQHRIEESLSQNGENS